MTTYVGKPLPRLEDARFLRGEAKFTDDLSLSGQAFAIVHRSPHAHAAIKAINTEDARAVPGVLAVLTAADLRAGGMGEIPSLTAEVPLPPSNTDRGPFADASQYPLAEDRVRYVGEPVAFIVAETRDAARDASELIEVDYDPLPAVTTLDDALAAGATQIWDDGPGNRSLTWDNGDADATDAAFATAAHTVELTVEYPREFIAFMEPRSVLASFDEETGRFTVRVGCQSGHVQKILLARIVGVDADDIHVIVPETGGGFGSRNVTYPEFPLAMFAARALGRPVAWTADRSEAFLTDSQARSQRLTGALALDADGTFTAIRVLAQWWHGGYILPRSVAVMVAWMAPMTCGPYRLPTHHFTLEGIFTNTAPMAAFRGVARAEMTYLIERLVDAAAKQTGVDRIELRRRNLIDRKDMPWHSPTGAVYQPADFKRSLEIGLETIDVASFSERKTKTEANGLLRGLGITTYIENAGGALSDYAEVEVCGNEAEGVVVHVGTQDFGMGHATVYAQVIADVLGVTPETIHVNDGDTDRIPTGAGSHGSRSMRIGRRGGAARRTAGRARDLRGPRRQLPQRRASLRGRGRSGDRRGHAGSLRHRLGSGPGHQSAAGGRPAPWRPRARDRPGRARTRRLRPRHRPASLRQLHGFRHAPRRRHARRHRRLQSGRRQRQSARRQGHRGGSDHRLPAHRGQCRARRAGPARRRPYRHAAHTGDGLARHRPGFGDLKGKS
ncbi:MAG: xanthine dehydrogenase family protein molybdopterin-binding subunit [Alphaproteobacteria bacterium]